jgi:hypothetical protein
MNLDLTNEQAELLLRELDQIIENDRYFLSPRIKGLQEIRGMIQPYPPRPLAQPTKHYEPPRATAARRRQASR